MRMRVVSSLVLCVLALLAFYCLKPGGVLVKDRNHLLQIKRYSDIRRLAHSAELYKQSIGTYPDSLDTLAKSDSVIRDIDISVYHYITNGVLFGKSNLFTISTFDPWKTNATIVGVLGGEVKSIQNDKLELR